MENILQKIFTHYLSDDIIKEKEKTIKNIPGIKKVNINVNRDIELYQTKKYFTKFDKRISEQKKYILTKNTLDLGKFPKEIIINNILHKELPNNIVKIHNYYFNNTNQILIMENIPMTIKEYITKNKQDTNKINTLCTQLFLIFAILQEKYQFMHKDLHLGNILLKHYPHENIHYTFQNKTYTIKSYNITPVLINFATSTIFKLNNHDFTIYDINNTDMNNKYVHGKQPEIITNLKKYIWYIRDVNIFNSSFDIFYFIHQLSEILNVKNIPILNSYILLCNEFPNYSIKYISPGEFILNNLKQENKRNTDLTIIKTKPNYTLPNTDIPVIIIPKNTLLFRVVLDQITDFVGIPLPGNKYENDTYVTEKYVIYPQQNVFFYFSPYIVDLIPKWFSNFKKLYVFVTTHDLINVSLISTYKYTRRIKYSKNDIMISCDKIDNKLIKQNSSSELALPSIEIKGRYYDPCFTNNFLNKHNNVNGWISTAITDAAETIKNFNKNKEKYTKYTKFIQNKVNTIGPPEIALYPLKDRVNTNIVIDADKIDSFINSNTYNYQLIKTFDRNYTTIQKWMDKHAVINENKFYFTYK